MNNWINVNDRMPEAAYPLVDGEWVLAWDSKDNICLLLSRTFEDHKKNLWEWKDETGHCYGGTFSKEKRITHWMPLPSGPN